MIDQPPNYNPDSVMREYMRRIAPVTLSLTDYEIAIILDSISSAPVIEEMDDYILRLMLRATMYQIYQLHRRLVAIRLKCRKVSRVTLNPTELMVVQHILQPITHDNITAAVLYGKIHQKTL